MDTMTNDISKIQNETQSQLTLKMMEIKEQYLDHLKASLNNNVSEKIQPILKEHSQSLMDKTHLLLNDLIPKNQQHIKGELKESLQRFENSILKEQYNPNIKAYNKDLKTKHMETGIWGKDALEHIKSLNLSSNKNIILDIYGIGKYEEHLKKLIKVLDLEKKVFLKGFLNENLKFNTISSYDYFLCLDMADFRLSCFESLKCKTPVILTTESFPNPGFDSLKCLIYSNPDIKSLKIIFDCLNKDELNKIDWDQLKISLEKLEWSNYFRKIDEIINSN